MVGVTQNCHSISLSLVIFKYLNFITFGAQMLSTNKLQYTSLKLFQLKKIPLKPYQNFSGMLLHINSKFNVFIYVLTRLTLISEKLATTHEKSNGKSFLDLIGNRMWLQGLILKKIGILKYVVSCRCAVHIR